MSAEQFSEIAAVNIHADASATTACTREVCMVERVEEFAPELQVGTFGDFEIPDGGDVPVLQAGS